MTELEAQPATVRKFRRTDQPEVRALVLRGLGDHFSVIDETLNPDLDDIWTSYVATGGTVLVAERDGRIVAAGTLTSDAPGVGRLVRMSVDRAARGQGLGRRLVSALIEAARERGDRTVLVETSHDWWDAIRLYRACGFTELGVRDGDRHFSLDL